MNSSDQKGQKENNQFKITKKKRLDLVSSKLKKQVTGNRRP